jgi:hypothetical protein
VQTYVSPYKSPPTGFLVVEGYISANSPTQYSLTRTIGLPGDSTIPVVTGATVQVQGSDSSLYTLPDQGNGIYGGTTLSLNPALQYRLSIQTPKGESYQSEFVPLKVTPPIDSVNWVYKGSNGVNIYVNTHDLNNATRYYQWTYDQTWVYYSPQESFWVYDTAANTVVPRLSNQFNYRCWSSVASSDLLLDNTTKLAQDIVYEYPLVNIPDNSIELSSLYSIQVSEYALTLDAYNFLTQMQVNTESLGSIFDVQPTELTGNIHCLNNPTEQVIGYISAGTVQQQRIFIAEDQLPAWEFNFECANPNYVVPNIPDTLKAYFLYGGWMPLDVVPGGYTANSADCIDCRLRGGSTQKPSFWPN